MTSEEWDLKDIKSIEYIDIIEFKDFLIYDVKSIISSLSILGEYVNIKNNSPFKIVTNVVYMAYKFVINNSLT